MTFENSCIKYETISRLPVEFILPYTPRISVITNSITANTTERISSTLHFTIIPTKPGLSPLRTNPPKHFEKFLPTLIKHRQPHLPNPTHNDCHGGTPPKNIHAASKFLIRQMLSLSTTCAHRSESSPSRHTRATKALSLSPRAQRA